MQLTTALLAAFSVAATTVQAQNLTGLPDCAVTCFESQLVNSACADTTNVTCLCEDATYFSDVELCVLSSCDTADTSTTLTWAEATCAAAGVSLRKAKRALQWIFGRQH